MFGVSFRGPGVRIVVFVSIQECPLYFGTFRILPLQVVFMKGLRFRVYVWPSRLRSLSGSLRFEGVVV